MWQVLINQSTCSRRWGLFCISSVCFFLGFFFSWQEVPRAYQQLKEEPHSFSRDSTIPPLFSICVYLSAFPHLEPFLSRSNKPQTGQGSSLETKFTLEIWVTLLQKVSLLLIYRWVAEVTCFSLCTACGRILLSYSQASIFAFGKFYQLFTINRVVWFLPEWKYNESFPCSHLRKLDWSCPT